MGGIRGDVDSPDSCDRAEQHVEADAVLPDLLGSGRADQSSSPLSPNALTRVTSRHDRLLGLGTAAIASLWEDLGGQLAVAGTDRMVHRDQG